MQNESDYEYRIVLELTDGRRIPLWAPNSLEEAREHLQHILDDLGIPKGWIECRPRDTYWSAFCPAQRPAGQDEEQEDEMTRLHLAAIKLVAALDHWSAEGGGPEPRSLKINSATGRQMTRVALEELREILSATTTI